MSARQFGTLGHRKRAVTIETATISSHSRVQYVRVTDASLNIYANSIKLTDGSDTRTCQTENIMSTLVILFSIVTVATKEYDGVRSDLVSQQAVEVRTAKHFDRQQK